MFQKWRVAILLLLTMMVQAPARAEVNGQTAPALVVWCGETELYSFFVANEPVLKVQDGNAIIQSDGEWEEEVGLHTYKNNCYYSIPMSESSEYRITLEQRDYMGVFGHSTPTSIEETAAVVAHPTFSVKDGVLQVAGLQKDQTVIVAAVDGKVAAQAEADENGRATASLHQIKGIAIVKAGNVSFKVQVR